MCFVGCLTACADEIMSISSTAQAGISFYRTSQYGTQYVAFSNLVVTGPSGDSVNGAPVILSPGANGAFALTRISSDFMSGYLAIDPTAIFTVGNASSGILSGSIQMTTSMRTIVISTDTSKAYPGGDGGFQLTFYVTNLKATHCTTPGCTDSAMLQDMAKDGGANASFGFSFSPAVATDAWSLINFHSGPAHTSELGGALLMGRNQRGNSAKTPRLNLLR